MLLCWVYTPLWRLYTLPWRFHTPLYRLYRPMETSIGHIWTFARLSLNCPFVLEIAWSPSIISYLQILNDSYAAAMRAINWFCQEWTDTREDNHHEMDQWWFSQWAFESCRVRSFRCLLFAASYGRQLNLMPQVILQFEAVTPWLDALTSCSVAKMDTSCHVQTCLYLWL
jgi:hypothetical protein